jgi:selenide,water dikinase
VSLPSASAGRNAFAGLRALANCGGCAAKADPDLVRALTAAAAAGGRPDPALLAGLAPYDDAAVYRVGAGRAVVSTVDFFPPLVDDAADYGAVAAANAVSDVYAMGGEVAFALVLSGFPESVPPDAVAAATAAAAGVVADCGGQVAGGHSIRCAEPVFGLAVTGLVDPAQVWRKSGARPGDVLLLSKPLGTGVLLATGNAIDEAGAVAAMRETNRAAAWALRDAGDGVHAVTDVTGYGLLGHAAELGERSGARIRIASRDVPFIAGALAAARSGVRTSADARTRRALGGRVAVSRRVPGDVDALLYDPQTSGGLLAAVDPGAAASLAARGFHAIGSIEAGPADVVVD